MFTGVYGPAHHQQGRILDGIKGVKRQMGRHWVVGVNFNVIHFTHEKNLGGRITRSMRDFEEFVRSSNLQDNPLCNAKYTWTNG